MKKFAISILAGFLAVLLIWLVSKILMPGFFYRFEAITYDWRCWYVASQPPSKPIEDIVIVDVDARSVNKLGKFYQWPRSYWKLAIEHLLKGGVRWIAFDFIFDRDLRNPDEDETFINAIKQAGNVFGALYFTMADSAHFLYSMASEPAGFQSDRFRLEVPADLQYSLIQYERIEPDFPELLNAFRGVGFVNLIPDPDGVIRKTPLLVRFNEHVYPSFALALALTDLRVNKIDFDEKHSELLLNTKNHSLIHIPIDSWGRLLVYYHGPYQSFRYISFYDVLMGFVPAEYFKDKIVIFGSSLPGLFDLRSTPIQPAFPGVEINANVLHQILNRHFYYEFSPWQKFLILLAIGVLTGMLLSSLRPLGSILITLFLSFLTLIAAFFVFANYHYWLPLITPLLVILLTFTIHYIYRYLIEEKDKRLIKRMFSHYVSPTLVEQLMKSPDKLKLGGEKRECSVLFSDLAGFTTLSEKMAPEDLVKLLNAYATEMTEIILDNDGTLDKYEGDAIMAIFGAPLNIGNHAVKACRAALSMQKRLEKLRGEWKKKGLPELHQRIGVNTGMMIVGNMGSSERFDYTVVGDAVNLAARLEGVNKLYDTQIIIGEGTFLQAREQVVARLLDLVRVKGKKEPVKIYELISMKSEPLDMRTRQVLDHFQQGLQHYLARNWDLAMSQFRQALQIKPTDGPSRLYLLRCQEFLYNPPPDDWDGVFTMKTK